MGMQCKDIPEQPVLSFIAQVQRGEDVRSATWFEGFENSVQNAMPIGVPRKLALAKMNMMIRKGVVSGCGCGCRGDFELTPKGLTLI